MLRRRTLLTLPAALAVGACASPPAPRPARWANPEDAETARLWLDRLTWGANDASLAEVQAMGLAAWREQQLQPGAWPPPLPADVQGRLDGLRISQTPTDTLVRQFDEQRRAATALTDAVARQRALQQWFQDMNQVAREGAQRQLLRAVHSPRQLQSRMGWFWFNHFNVFQTKSSVRVLVADYDEQLQRLALGRFRDLLGAAICHPAMLRYLDNEQNVAGRLNENLGRELLELHTLGADGGYSQADVLALSRVLTGLAPASDGPPPRPEATPPQRRGLSAFSLARHDRQPKLLLGEPVQGEGLDELDQVLDRLARHPATARHVCRRLAEYLMGPPSAALQQQLARRFLDSDGRIDEVLRALFASAEFEASLGRRFKDPMHWVLSAVRQGLPAPGLVHTSALIDWLQRLGQAPYARQTPDGYPLEASAWDAPGQFMARFDLARALAGGPPSLYRDARSTDPTPPPAPQWQGPMWRQLIEPRLSASTRRALSEAGANSRLRATLWLSSPEFMQH